MVVEPCLAWSAKVDNGVGSPSCEVLVTSALANDEDVDEEEDVGKVVDENTTLVSFLR